MGKMIPPNRQNLSRKIRKFNKRTFKSSFKKARSKNMNTLRKKKMESSKK